MLAGMPSSVFSMWVAYFQLEPFGELRADWRSAQEQATLANLNRARSRPAYDAKDFLLRFESPQRRPRPSGDGLRAKIDTAFFKLGGKDLRKG